MRIAVISDTHDRFPANLLPKLSSADEIWHLGDVCEPSVLAEFDQLGPPLKVVQGNCDDTPWPLDLTLTRLGHVFYLIHIPPLRAPVGVNFVLHGHTHVPRDEMIGSVRWLNPGCISRPNRGAPASFAWLTLAPAQLPDWQRVLI